jgi:perosamine synthetase
MQMRPWFGEEEKKAINSYMEEDGFITEFKNTELLEKKIDNFTNTKECILVNNGTISLTLAALALDIKAGDEVIIPNYTMIAGPNSIQIFGGKPVFVDVEKETLCLDIKKTKKAITPKTKAIMLMSANGRYPKSGINSFLELCKNKNISLIEDAAQSLGSFYPDGSHIGSKGDIGSFSFSAPKIISTGQGGALITNNTELASRLRKLKDFGRSSGGNDVHDSIGYNFKFTELQAVIGIEQMKKLAWRIDRKKAIYKRFTSNLRCIQDEIKFFEHNFEFTTPWFIDCVAKKRDELQVFLKEHMIGTRIMYPPINKQKAYKYKGEFPVSDHIGQSGLWLPSMSQINDGQIDYVTEKIIDFYSN